MTYSLVARDAVTGELGVAVQSRSFGTGRVVPWAEAGIGAVATQSFTLPSYGPDGLALLREGIAPAAALAELTAKDDLRDFRQVGIIDAAGRTANHTGSACVPSTGFVAGPGYSAQGNMLDGDGVIPALAEGFERANGPLAERLLAGLDAAQAAGGDFRGCEAGAILVVGADGPVSDVRVDNHLDPLGELRRLLRMEQALRSLRRAGDDELDEAADEARAAGIDDDVLRWVAAVGLLARDPEAARSWLAPLAERDGRWSTALDRAGELLARSDA